MNARCPDEERLVDYLEGRLAGEDRIQVEEHVSGCQSCLEVFVITKTLVRSMGELKLDPVPTAVTEAAVRMVAGRYPPTSGSLTEGIKGLLKEAGSRILEVLSPTSWGQSGPVPVRSSKLVRSENLVSMQVAFRDVQTEIEIEKAGENRAHIRVRLPERDRLGRAVRVTLKQGEREVASHLADDGLVLFEDTAFGHYSLALTSDGVDLGTFPFEIKESKSGRG